MEPEYGCLGDWIAEGDWVVDVGANVGHYTVRLSQLVGVSGRFESLSIPQFSSRLANFYCAGLTSTSPWPHNPDEDFKVPNRAFFTSGRALQSLM